MEWNLSRVHDEALLAGLGQVVGRRERELLGDDVIAGEPDPGVVGGEPADRLGESLVLEQLVPEDPVADVVLAVEVAGIVVQPVRADVMQQGAGPCQVDVDLAGRRPSGSGAARRCRTRSRSACRRGRAPWPSARASRAGRRISSSVGIRMPPQRSGQGAPSHRSGHGLRNKSYADKIICIRYSSLGVTVETLTPGQAADAGLSRSGLYRAAAAGRFERIARGLYRPADAAPADWDWIEAASRRRDATICLTSGLAYYDLTDAIPRTLDIAIPRGSRIPAGDSAISWHLFDRATFSIGRDAIEIPGTSLPIGSTRRSAASSMRSGFANRSATNSGAMPYGNGSAEAVSQDG